MVDAPCALGDASRISLLIALTCQGGTQGEKKEEKMRGKKKEKIREIGKKYWKREKEGKKERKKHEGEKTINCGLKEPHIVPDSRGRFFSVAPWSRSERKTQKK